MRLPAWQTTWEVFAYCWRERGPLLRHGAIPLALSIAASLAVEKLQPLGAGLPELGLSDITSINPQAVMASLGNALIVFLLQLLIFLPLSVTWYRLVVFGETDALSRPLFSFGHTERRLLLWQLVLAGIVVLPLGAMTGLMLAFGRNGGTVSSALTLAYLIAGIGSIVLLCRLSLVMALAAADAPVSLGAAWRLSNGLGWQLFLALGTISLVTGVAASLLGAVSDAKYVTVVEDNVASLILLVAFSTLFGLVYRRLTDSSAA